MKQKKQETIDLLNKYFDDVVTSSGIDPSKRPDAVLQWAREKDLWAQQSDIEMRQHLLDALNKKAKAKEFSKLHNKKLVLADLQKIRLEELKKREEYLKTLNRDVKLPKINRKMLNTEIIIPDNIVLPTPSSFERISKNDKSDDNYGSMLMKGIGSALREEYEIYNQPPPKVVEKSIVAKPNVMKVRKRFVIYKKGPGSKW